MLCSYNFRGIGFYCRFCRCIEGRSCVAQIQQNSAVISREFHPKGTLYELDGEIYKRGEAAFGCCGSKWLLWTDKRLSIN